MRERSMHLPVRAGLAAFALIIVVAACGSSAASPSASATSHAPKHGGMLARGDITAVSASSITIVTTRQQTQTFSLAPDVAVRQAGRAVPFATLVSGDSVVLYASASSGNATPGGTPTVGRIKITTPKATASPSPSPSPT